MFFGPSENIGLIVDRFELITSLVQERFHAQKNSKWPPSPNVMVDGDGGDFTHPSNALNLQLD